MKTILEHFESFPEPYKSQALDNLEAYRETTGVDLSKSQKASAHAALFVAFPWSESPEGFVYWLDFSTVLKSRPSEPTFTVPQIREWLEGWKMVNGLGEPVPSAIGVESLLVLLECSQDGIVAYNQRKNELNKTVKNPPQAS